MGSSAVARPAHIATTAACARAAKVLCSMSGSDCPLNPLYVRSARASEAPIEMVLRFGFNERKAIETLAYIAKRWPDITPFFASKVLFFAEKQHLNAYGRPIVADTFIAMPWGPVPSTVYDFVKGN